MSDRWGFIWRGLLSRAAKWASLVVLIAILSLIVVTVVRRSRQAQVPLPARAEPVLSDKVISITEGYRYTSTKEGRLTFQLLAARDTSYADGRHDLESLDLTSYSSEGKENLRVQAARGTYQQSVGIVTLTGQVRVTSPDGLEVMTESLTYQQREDVASTDVAIAFRRGDLSGSSTGAVLHAKTRALFLQKDVCVVNAAPARGGLPVEIRSQRADYDEAGGVLRFIGEAKITQGKQMGAADAITGFLNPQSRRIDRIELRGHSLLRDERERPSSLESVDMTFFFDEAQHLKMAVAAGQARAHAEAADGRREIAAEKLEAHYAPGEESSTLASISSQGRTAIKLSPDPASAGSEKASERSIEADAMQVRFHPGGEFISEAEAAGNAVILINPLSAGPKAERKRVRAPRLVAAFYPTGNAIRSFVGEGGVTVEIEPLEAQAEKPQQAEKGDQKGDQKAGQKTKRRERRVLTGRKLSGQLHEATQEISELQLEGDTRYTEGERNASAARASYTAHNETLELRGEPAIWDATARTHAAEIDVHLGEAVSQARTRVRTTYYSRETTGDAAPFKKSKAPVFITSERAVVRHNEGAARYLGKVRAWQDDNFVSAETIELDRGERTMVAWDDVQSALYSVEREDEKGVKQVVPLFVSSDRLTYRDETRTVSYDGRVKLRQGSDRIEAAKADAIMDDENRLTRLQASGEVVLTQPERRATGREIEYLVASETAILQGDLATIEDRARGVRTKGARLTLHLRDARIEINDESGAKRVRTTHRIQR